jgi:hypothetical protein
MALANPLKTLNLNDLLRCGQAAGTLLASGFDTIAATTNRT